MTLDMMRRCPLCRSQCSDTIETIDVKTLERLYHRMLGESIIGEFNEDQAIKFYHCRFCDLKFFDPPVTGSEGFYEKLQKFDWYYLQDKEEYETALRYINNSHRVLEVGCGSGAFFKHITPKSYLGLELSRKAKNTAEGHGVRIANETIETHAASHKRYYDVVCAFQVLEHVADVRSFLSASLECLKSGGLIILSVPSADSFVSLAPNNILNAPPHHVTWWPDKSLKFLASAFNLELIQLEHESLADIHLTWYASVAIERSINRFFRRPEKLIDGASTRTAIHIIAALLGTIYAQVMRNKPLRPVGHSVTMVCRKTAGGP